MDAELVKVILCFGFALFCLSAVFYRFFGDPKKVAKLLAEQKKVRNPQRPEDVDREKLRKQADVLLREGAAWVVIVYKDYSDSWISGGRYLPVGHDDEVLPRSYCVLGDFPMSRDGLKRRLTI